jgi:hypothetical protein
MARHKDVHLRPVEERDLGFLERNSTEPALSEPFEWHGYRDPTVHRRRWEQDRYLGQQDARLVVALPDEDRSYAGFVVWSAMEASGQSSPTGSVSFSSPTTEAEASVRQLNAFWPITCSPPRWPTA